MDRANINDPYSGRTIRQNTSERRMKYSYIENGVRVEGESENSFPYTSKKKKRRQKIFLIVLCAIIFPMVLIMLGDRKYIKK